MKVAVTGASGLIGKATTKLLSENGIDCIGLSRNATNPLYNHTDYSVESLKKIFTGCDAVIHLAAQRGGV